MLIFNEITTTTTPPAPTPTEPLGGIPQYPHPSHTRNVVSSSPKITTKKEKTHQITVHT